MADERYYDFEKGVWKTLLVAYPLIALVTIVDRGLVHALVIFGICEGITFTLWRLRRKHWARTDGSQT